MLHRSTAVAARASRAPLAWNAAPKRKATGLGIFAATRGIGIHPSLLIETRDGSKGTGLFLRDAVDAQTQLLVVPASAVVRSDALSVLGHDGPCPTAVSQECASKISASAAGPVVGSLLGTEDWVESAWRLALEHSSRSSRWWGWLGSVPDAAAFADHRAACSTAVRLSTPAQLGQFERLMAAVDANVDDAFTVLRSSPGILCPPMAAFRWAVHVLLSRSTLLPSTLGLLDIVDPSSTSAQATNNARELGEDDAAVEAGEAPQWRLAVLPFIDMANHSAVLPTAAVEVLTEAELPSWYTDPERASSPYDDPQSGVASASGFTSPSGSFDRPRPTGEPVGATAEDCIDPSASPAEQRAQAIALKLFTSRSRPREPYFFTLTTTVPMAPADEATVRYDNTFPHGTPDHNLYQWVRYAFV